MTDLQHREVTVARGNHIIHAWDVADETARDALTPSLTSADLGKVCRVPDNYFVLMALEEVDGEGGLETVAYWFPLVAFPSDDLPSALTASPTFGIQDAYSRADHAHDASSKAGIEQPINEQTGNYTLQASDSGKLVRVTSASAAVVTVPDTFAPAAGHCIVISIARGGAGALSVVGSGTMVVSKATPYAANARDQYSEITLRIFSTTSSRLSGDLGWA